MRVPRPPRLPRWQGGPEIPWMMTLGHYMPYGYAAALAGEVAWDAAGSPSGGPLHWVSQVLWLTALGMFAAEYTQHREHLCERCAAATPLDPQKQVRRWKMLLRLIHVEGLFWVMAALWAVQVAAFHVGALAPAKDAADVVITTAFTVIVAAGSVHSRLQPWCPYCHWGKGGDHEASPEVPDPAVSR